MHYIIEEDLRAFFFLPDFLAFFFVLFFADARFLATIITSFLDRILHLRGTLSKEIYETRQRMQEKIFKKSGASAAGGRVEGSAAEAPAIKRH